jgi:hypothetical protein
MPDFEKFNMPLRIIEALLGLVILALMSFDVHVIHKFDFGFAVHPPGEVSYMLFCVCSQPFLLSTTQHVMVKVCKLHFTYIFNTCIVGIMGIFNGCSIASRKSRA